AARRADRVQVKANRRSDSQLEILTAVPHHNRFRHPFGGTAGFTVEYQIHAPRNSKLVIHHSGGDVLITSVAGEIEASNHAGSITVLLPETGKYAIDAKTDIGIVSSDFDGNYKHRNLIGIGFAENAAAAATRIRLRVGVGGITIKSSPPAAQPVSGNLP